MPLAEPPASAALLAYPFVLPSYRILSRHLTPMLVAILTPLTSALPTRLDRPFLIGLVVDVAPRDPEHQHRQNHNDDEQNPRLRRCQPDPIALEGVEEQV